MNYPRWFAVLLSGLLLLDTLVVWGQSQTVKFTHFGTDEGLSHSNVFGIVQDHQGFMWFGTLDGLNKFDGYRFTVYKNDPANASSISNNHISAIKEDRDGNLWVATRGGLNRLDRRRNAFVRYQHQAANPHSLSDNSVNSLMIDQAGFIWVATNNGLNCFDPRTERFTRFLPDARKRGAISDNAVTCLLEDARHRIWVGTSRGGLNRFDRQTQSFTSFQPEPGTRRGRAIGSIVSMLEGDNQRLWIGTRGEGLSVFNPETRRFTSYLKQGNAERGLPTRTVLSLEKDQNGHIWVGTENDGVSIFNPVTERFINYRHDEIDRNSLTNNSVYSIYRDTNGNVWLGIYGGGVGLLNRDANMFTHYKHTSASNSLNHNTVLTFFEDSDANVWLGTDGGGVSLFDHRRKTFTPLRHDDSRPNSLAGNYVLSIAEDNRKRLWVGTWNDGLSVYDRKRKTFTNYRHNPADPASLSSDNVYSVLMDRDKTMWVGTYDGGLARYDPAIDGFRHYRHNPADANSIASNALHHLIQDRRGYIWIATANAGVDRFDPRRKQFAHFTHHDATNSLSNNNALFLYEDRAGNIWITTATGLSCYDPLRHHFTNYLVRDGLPNDVVNGILEDETGSFWISTNGGLSRFTPKTKSFQNFTVADGLQASEFKQHACLRTRSGQLYFGGSNGFNVFEPAQIQTSSFDPPLLFTNLLVLNKEVPVARHEGDDSPLKQPISETRALTLPYRSAVIGFEFASLNYTISSKKRYAYRLSGFDQNWTFVGTTRTATYTNLDPGQYVFAVKGLTNKGEWSDRVLSLSLTIEAPFWLTWWFKLLIASLILGSVFGFYRVRINAVNAHRLGLEKIIVERTERLQQEQLLNKMKSQFVSTASHEFRTPLATIQSSVDLVAMHVEAISPNGLPETEKTGILRHLTIIEKEIDKFSDLLNDVLSIEQMNAGKISFLPHLADISHVCDDVISSHFRARKDRRVVDVLVTGTPRPVLLDEKLISHALTNLLSNAFKYSTTNPTLHINFGSQHLGIAITDRGIGIPQEDLAHLFETFYRAGNVSSIQGTGLGLFIARQFVELHGGTISVQSQENVSTTFTITLPAEPATIEVSPA